MLATAHNATTRIIWSNCMNAHILNSFLAEAITGRQSKTLTLPLPLQALITYLI
jgi:hypothetical protein